MIHVRKENISNKELYLLQDGRCFYCRTPLLPRTRTEEHLNGYTRDHFFSRLTKPTLINNKVLSCNDCNVQKGRKRPTKRQRVLFSLIVRYRCEFDDADKLMNNYKHPLLFIKKLRRK